MGRLARAAFASSTAFLAALAACGTDATPLAYDPSENPADAAADGVTDVDPGRMDALSVDSGDAYVASPALHVFARRGAVEDDTGAPHGPAIVLDGGYQGARVLEWLHDATYGAEAGRGDVLVLTAGGGDASGGWPLGADVGHGFHSVQTVALDAGATASDFRIAADIAARTEVVWFTGGDQAAYVRWKGTPLLDAVDGVLRRGGAVGGTSAGMIIMGEHVNDALVTISENITSAVAVANPYDTRLHFTERVLHVDLLSRVVTDPHFSARDRMGRLAAFMARQVKDGFAAPDVLGVAVDDGAALVIAADATATRLAESDTSASAVYVVRGTMPTAALAGAPLVYRNLHVVKIARAAHAFDFTRRCGRGFVRDFDVDGNSSPPYPASAYADGAFANECP